MSKSGYNFSAFRALQYKDSGEHARGEGQVVRAVVPLEEKRAMRRVECVVEQPGSGMAELVAQCVAQSLVLGQHLHRELDRRALHSRLALREQQCERQARVARNGTRRNDTRTLQIVRPAVLVSRGTHVIDMSAGS